jgi:hypothetical protein
MLYWNYNVLELCSIGKNVELEVCMNYVVVQEHALNGALAPSTSRPMVSHSDDSSKFRTEQKGSTKAVPTPEAARNRALKISVTADDRF